MRQVGSKGDGSVEYTVSTFGELLYTDTSSVRVLIPPTGNERGCDELLPPTGLPTGQKFMWVLERGSCTYSKKAFNSQKAGAYAVLVFHEDPLVNIANVIPVSDSVYNNIKIPIILVSNADGKKIVAGGKAAGEINAQVHLDSETSETAKVVEAEYWMNPASMASYDFILKFREYLMQMREQVKLNVKYKYKDLSGEKNKDGSHCFSKGKFCATETMGFEP